MKSHVRSALSVSAASGVKGRNPASPSVRVIERKREVPIPSHLPGSPYRRGRRGSGKRGSPWSRTASSTLRAPGRGLPPSITPSSGASSLILRPFSPEKTSHPALALVCSGPCGGANTPRQPLALPPAPEQGLHLLSCAWAKIPSSIIHSLKTSSSFINLESHKIINFS